MYVWPLPESRQNATFLRKLVCNRSAKRGPRFINISQQLQSHPASRSCLLCTLMDAPPHLVTLRCDGVRGTILRRRPDTSQSSDVWVEGEPEVMNGDAVTVIASSQHIRSHLFNSARRCFA